MYLVGGAKDVGDSEVDDAGADELGRGRPKQGVRVVQAAVGGQYCNWRRVYRVSFTCTT